MTSALFPGVLAQDDLRTGATTSTPRAHLVATMSNAARLTLCAIALAVVLLGLPALILLGVRA